MTFGTESLKKVYIKFLNCFFFLFGRQEIKKKEGRQFLEFQCNYSARKVEQI